MTQDFSTDWDESSKDLHPIMPLSEFLKSKGARALDIALENLESWQTAHISRWRSATRGYDDNTGDVDLPEPPLSFYLSPWKVCAKALPHIFNGDVLQEFSDGDASGYVIAVEPFSNAYRTAAQIGHWPPGRTAVWNQWMSQRASKSRRLGEGLLGKAIIGRPPRHSLVFDWMTAPYISPDTRKLGFRHVNVVQVYSSRYVVGVFVLDFPHGTKDAPSATAIAGAAATYYLAQLVIAPLIGPASFPVGEHDLVDIVERNVSAVARGIKSDAAKHFATLHEQLVASTPVSTREWKWAESNVYKSIDRRANGYINSLWPNDPVHSKATVKAPSGIDQTHSLSDITSRVIGALRSDRELRFIDELLEAKLLAIRSDWNEAARPPVSDAALMNILAELLANSAKAIGDLLDLIKADLPPPPEERAWDVNAQLKEYGKLRDDGAPHIRLSSRFRRSPRGQVVFVEVSDNGIGMFSYDVERCWEFGFSMKRNGTGGGLNIVRRNVEAVGGGVRILSIPPTAERSLQDGMRTKVQMVFPMSLVAVQDV